MIAAALAALILTTHHASPAELHAKKRAFLEEKARSAREEALAATLEGTGAVAAAVAVPVASGTTAALLLRADPRAPAVEIGKIVLGVGACVSTCLAVPVGLIFGFGRLGDAQAIAADADLHEARLRAFDADTSGVDY